MFEIFASLASVANTWALSVTGGRLPALRRVVFPLFCRGGNFRLARIAGNAGRSRSALARFASISSPLLQRLKFSARAHRAASSVPGDACPICVELFFHPGAAAKIFGSPTQGGFVGNRWALTRFASSCFSTLLQRLKSSAPCARRNRRAGLSVTDGCPFRVE